MTTEEFKLFIAAIRTYYVKENLFPNEHAISLWYRELQDIPYSVAETALRKWVATNKWAPTIADIRATATSICKQSIPDWSEAWESVLLAVRQYGTYQPVEALESLDERTRSCVRRIGYNNICMSQNISIERNNFKNMYEATATRDAIEQLLPPSLTKAIADIYQSSVLSLEYDIDE